MLDRDDPTPAAFRLDANTGDAAVTGLIDGPDRFWSAEATYGMPQVITYSFMDSAPAYYGGGVSGFQPFNATMEAAARAALQDYADVADLRFVEVPDGGGGGQIRFGSNVQGAGTAGYAYEPTKLSYGTNTVGFTAKSGDVWVDNTDAYNLAPAPGNYGTLVLLHEIGHALGLKHPHEAPTVPAGLDTVAQTVMSYNHGSAPYPSDLGPLDVRAIEYLYGPDEPKVIGNMWADDGTSTNMGGDAGQNYLLGRGGNDTIAGGAGNDGLLGGAGADLIFGNEGDDFVLSNQQSDHVDLGPGDDTLYGGQGPDFIEGKAGADWLIGNRQNDTIYAHGGSDHLYGGQEQDLIVAGPGHDDLFGNRGNDTLIGGSGFDSFVFGDASGADTIKDFEPVSDEIYVKSNANGSGITSEAAARAHLVDDGHGNAVLDLGGGNAVTIEGASAAAFHAYDFEIF